MANFNTAFNFMIQNEDSTKSYRSAPDCGGFAIAGINSNSFPNDYATINAIPQAQRGPAVQQFYQTHFWNKWLEQLSSDELSARVFDTSVNMGAKTAVMLLQRGLGITVDGVWGPSTVSAANALVDAVERFKAQRADHYKQIAANDPSKVQYLKGWLARAQK